jgi:hypothetical protein
MWIRTCDGHLANSLQFQRITVRSEPDWEEGVENPTPQGRVVAVMIDCKSEDTLDIFRGDLEECRRIHSQIANKLGAINITWGAPNE